MYVCTQFKYLPYSLSTVQMTGSSTVWAYHTAELRDITRHHLCSCDLFVGLAHDSNGNSFGFLLGYGGIAIISDL